MSELVGIPLSALVPTVLGLYALAFIAGGIYCLEQRVARTRDQFPKRVVLTRLTGYAALAIGALAAISLGGHFVYPTHEFHLGALVAAAAGIAFWIYHVLADLTLAERVRDGLLVVVCIALAILTIWWIQML